MRTIFGLCFLFSLTVLGAKPATKSFHVESEIEIDGQVVAKPNFLTLPGQRASLTEIADQRITRVEVVAEDDRMAANSDAIMMKFKVALMHNGEKKTHEPTIITRPGEPAELAIGDSNGREIFRMKVLAKRDTETIAQ